MEENEKVILDAACGGRMFWVNQSQPNTIFMDERVLPYPLIEKYDRKEFTIAPDIVGDFRKIPFEDESFKLVVFDPPHLICGENSFMGIKYGTNKGKDYVNDLKEGFKECFRVLKLHGVLIFKWNDTCIPFNKIEPLFPIEPLIINRMGVKTAKTYWVVFMKLQKEAPRPAEKQKGE